VPRPALRAALRRAGPDIVTLWSQTSGTTHLAQLNDVATSRPRPKLVLAAGPGWDSVQLPDAVHRPTNLAEAVSLVIGVSPPGP
jgi:hypothetical protein